MSDCVQFRFSLPAAVWLTFVLFFDRSGGAVYSICAAAFHECGHLCVLFLLHDKPKTVSFGAFGMRIEQQGSLTLSYGQEFLVALAGPVCNLLLGMILLFSHLRMAAGINFALALFNLLPLRPMDGGQMLHALLCRKIPQERADKICKKIAVCGAFPLTAIGVWVLVRGGNYSLLLSSLYVVSLLLP